jgi:hypothetical protein
MRSPLDAHRGSAPAKRRRLVRVGLVVAMALPATQCLRQDEVECEEAVAHMADCCEDFDRSAVVCRYSDYCGVSYPDLRPSESQCILDRSCDSLREDGICEAVVRRSQTGASSSNDGYPEGEVCP